MLRRASGSCQSDLDGARRHCAPASSHFKHSAGGCGRAEPCFDWGRDDLDDRRETELDIILNERPIDELLTATTAMIVFDVGSDRKDGSMDSFIVKLIADAQGNSGVLPARIIWQIASEFTVADLQVNPTTIPEHQPCFHRPWLIECKRHKEMPAAARSLWLAPRNRWGGGVKTKIERGSHQATVVQFSA